jgi:hypothetical protein
VTLLLREVGRFLLEAAMWTGAVVALAAAVALPIAFVRSRRIRWKIAGFAAVGSAALAAAAYRFGLGLWSPEVAGRPLPVGWIVVGSAGIAYAILRGENAQATR